MRRGEATDEACLSNNLRALDAAGDVRSVCERVHGLPLEAVAAACGLRVEGVGAGEERDQVWIHWILDYSSAACPG